jgi:saccharopine dehydrogenase (NAD+, L-lysine-forming)
MMMFKGIWKDAGVFNVEQLPPEPFMEEVAKQGLPWHVKDLDVATEKELKAA